MKISINDKPVEIPQGLTITQLLEHQNVKMPDMVSVQLNGTIVERPAFPSTEVRENDTVDFLYFMGGGRTARARGGASAGGAFPRRAPEGGLCGPWPASHRPDSRERRQPPRGGHGA